MSFQVPYSSSPPPSTPDKRSYNSKNEFSFGGQEPSTTPAGPPPSATGSFTPAGPPPSSFLGSSMMGTRSPMKPLSFSQQSSFEATSSPSAGFMRSPPVRQQSGLGNEYHARNESEEEEEYSEEDRRQYGSDQQYEDDDADAMTDEDAQYEEDEQMDDYGSENRTSRTDHHGYDRSTSDLLLSTTEGLRKSREGGLNDSMSHSILGAKLSPFYTIAKDLYSRMPTPPVNESDDLILDTEATLLKIYEEENDMDEEDSLQEALATVPNELANLWGDYAKNIATYNSEEYTATIGPGPRATNFAKANFLAGLSLQIRHPPRGPDSLGRSRAKPLPLILLEWMDDHHNPYPSQFEEIQAHRPSPANHRLFWDTVFNGLLRGKIIAVINIMKGAGWRYARDETDDIRGQLDNNGFTGIALENVEKVIGAATHVLSQCPAAHGDWNIRNNDWTLFRLRVSQALEDLRGFAEGRNRDSRSETFGLSSISSRPGMYSRTAKKAESQVPWHIYQNLVTLYNLVIGDANAIIENAQDWCEATVGLLVWWDEGKDDRRLALGRSQSISRPNTRDSDMEVFLRKLRKSFEAATADSTDFAVNSADDVEVCLASLFEGDGESVVGFLRGWSGPVSSAVAEIASLGGWLPQTEEKSLINMGSLDQEDLDLLGVNSSPSKSDSVKDQALIAYAGSLKVVGQLKSTSSLGRPQVVREGWELAIAILGRLDSASRSEETIGNFLRDFPLKSSDTVDNLWKLLNSLGMNRHAESTAEAYATTLSEDSHKYGEALWYYALAHKTQKVKDVLDLLISYSLIQSTVYPPESELDDYLRRLISSPKSALTELSNMDIEAAELLHKMLSGYATLRKFYNLRDEEVQLATGARPRLGSRARKVQAASALIAVISSSDDNIRGGLYDEGRGAVVSVDFLLALLGEAMVFINQPDYMITMPQIDILLKAIEDLQAVRPGIYSACDGFLETVIASGQGLKGSTPADMLRKSTSNISGTSSFSMVGSSILASQLKQSMGGSGTLLKGPVKRGWDWRRGISASTTGNDVLRILRLGLARDLAKAFLAEADLKM